ncbi:MAG TPA: SLBB domain-containing protein [Candidatus Eisenbacteria bacterium]
MRAPFLKRAHAPALLSILALVMSVPAPAQSIDESLLPPSIREALNASPTTPVAEPNLPLTLGDGPVDPALYHLGPGDELTIRYRGRTTATHRLLVGPEGAVYLPDVGRIDLSGRTLSEGREALMTAARKILRDVTIEVDLTRVRSFKMSVTGQVARPGVYAATGSTRVFEILRMAGGVTDSAAVRDLRLVDLRTGESKPVDLLPFLLRGGPPACNPYVPDGATLVVPRRTRWVRLGGAVLQPGAYDLPADGTTVGDLLGLVGLEPDAVTDRIELGRLGEAPKGGTLADLAGTPLVHGDVVTVPRKGTFRRVDLVNVEGEVGFPGSYAVSNDTTRLADFLERAGGLLPGAQTSRILLMRRSLADSLPPAARRLVPYPTVILTLSEKEQLRARGEDGFRAVVIDLAQGEDRGPVLEPGDRILVPRRGAFVEVGGRVRRPGFYAWRAGATAEDYVADAGGWADRADKKQTRVTTGPGDNFRTGKDVGSLEPGDHVWVPEKIPRSGWENLRDAVVIVGQLATVVLLIDQLND